MAKLGALNSLSSQPRRVLSVTGTDTEVTTASINLAAKARSFNKAEPAKPFTTFFAGQPIFMSIICAPIPSTNFAVSEIA